MEPIPAARPRVPSAAAAAAPEAFPVWVDGRVLPAGTPAIAAEDQGLQLGLAVFDTVLDERGALLFVREHLRRLEAGARALEIPWPPPWSPEAALREVAALLGERSAVLRLTLTLGVPGRGPTLAITPRAIVPPPPEGVRVFVSTLRKAAVDALEAVKTTSRVRNVLARREAERHGAWEALLLNPEGDLCEGTLSNLFVVHRGTLRTSSLARGPLPGITREKLLESLEREPLRLEGGQPLGVVVERVEPLHVLEAEEVLLTNTSGRVTGVLSVGGLEREVGGLPGSAGPVARALRERMRRIEAQELARAGR